MTAFTVASPVARKRGGISDPAWRDAMKLNLAFWTEQLAQFDRTGYFEAALPKADKYRSRELAVDYAI